jgi:hypothetical protein
MAQFLSRFDVTPIQNLAAKDGEIVALHGKQRFDAALRLLAKRGVSGSG